MRHEVARLRDVPPARGYVVEAGGRTIALFNVDGVLYAMTNVCPHDGGPLGEGILQGTVVTCPWHGWPFDVTCGRRGFDGEGPSIRTFPVHVEDGVVFVDC